MVPESKEAGRATQYEVFQRITLAAALSPTPLTSCIRLKAITGHLPQQKFFPVVNEALMAASALLNGRCSP
jgi:hypothetical protein